MRGQQRVIEDNIRNADEVIHRVMMRPKCASVDAAVRTEDSILGILGAD
jgi:hypothetical protein